MRGFHRGRRRMPSIRSAAAIAVGSLLLLAALVPATYAAAPTPAAGSATVDGSTADWSLGATFFSDMTDAGVDGRQVRAKLYLKYDCDAEVLYGLVLVQGDEKGRQTRTDEAYVMIDGKKIIDSTHGQFAWVNGDGELADGFEGGAGLKPGSYTLRAHVLVADNSADGYTPMDVVGRNVPLEIECGEVGPTQGTPTPTPTPTPAATGGTKTPKPTPAETGGVAPTTSTRTLPPTDASAVFGQTSGGDGIRLVAVMLGAAIGTCLLFTPRRRRTPVERPVEEPTEDEPKK
jgi:hypothetical protein